MTPNQCSHAAWCLPLTTTKEKNMHDDYSCDVLPPKSHHIDWKLEHIDAENEKSDSGSKLIETKLGDVMTPAEMEILTTWFPKAAQTLAGVLRNRLQ
jgi:hypothetical protein